LTAFGIGFRGRRTNAVREKRVRKGIAWAALIIGLSGCSSMMGGNKLNQDADQLSSAVAGEPVQVTKQQGNVDSAARPLC
jgi:uncharacterized lipoprotein